MGLFTTLAQTTVETFETNTMTGAEAAGAGAFFFGWMMIWLVILVVLLVAYWKVFTKAGQPGWASLIPIYNTYVMLKIAGRPGWWLLLLLIPFVNIVALLFVSIDIAKAFGKDEIFGVVLLWLLTPIGASILGFGDAKYQGSAAPVAPVAPAPPVAPAV